MVAGLCMGSRATGLPSVCAADTAFLLYPLIYLELMLIYLELMLTTC